MNQAPDYLSEYVPNENGNHDQIHHADVLGYENLSSQRFLKCFFLYCVNTWYKLDHEIVPYFHWICRPSFQSGKIWGASQILQYLTENVGEHRKKAIG